MGKKAEISEEIRKAIVLCHENGVRVQEIMNKFKISSKSVYRMIEKSKHGLLNIQRRPGRPKCTTEKQDALLLRNCVKDRCASSLTLQKECSLSCSPRTIRKRLYDNNLKSYKPLKKPYITKVQAQKRLAWCRNYSEWTIEDWKKV